MRYEKIVKKIQILNRSALNNFKKCVQIITLPLFETTLPTTTDVMTF